MGRIEEITRLLDLGDQYDTKYSLSNEHARFLLSRLQVAEEALKKISTFGPDSDEMIHIAEEALEQILEDEKK